MFSGRVIRVPLAQGAVFVEQYLGVPYGQPPVGDKRFVMPQTASRWLNMQAVDATKWVS